MSSSAMGLHSPVTLQTSQYPEMALPPHRKHYTSVGVKSSLQFWKHYSDLRLTLPMDLVLAIELWQLSVNQKQVPRYFLLGVRLVV